VFWFDKRLASFDIEGIIDEDVPDNMGVKLIRVMPKSFLSAFESEADPEGEALNIG